ncbi:hypothetical protein [Bradyrhizobium sp. ORS 285]|uniref:hypothetical protein n=1 Tax=Bradyrhizobium sp. ORS 285 TaxID=115808 RepID=UPI00352E81BD
MTMITADSLPDDVATLKALVLAGQAAQLAAESKARNLEAEVRARTLLIEQMKFTIARLKHEQYGPWPEHLPRERIVYPAPAHCPCCGGDRLRKISEGLTETLELVPRRGARAGAVRRARGRSDEMAPTAD